MTARLIVICKPNRFTAKVQHFFARDINGNKCPEYPYHCGFIVEDSKHGEPMLYDMSVKMRSIPWSQYGKRNTFTFDLPVDISEEFLETYVGKINYGFADVALYPLLQATNFNWFGTHCSEFCNDVMWWHGMRTPWFPLDAPPSPCAMLKWAAANLPLHDLTNDCSSKS